MFERETICAIATARGGAISVIRVSGQESINIVDKIYTAPKEEKKLQDQNTQTLHFGTIKDGSNTVDEVLISVFKAPRSYTGENMAEISCHASDFIQSEIIRLLIQNGARLAKPGEFTQRAFMNGKMDLSQAEAVADVIASGNAAAHRLAFSQMRGGFTKELQNIRGQLLNFVTMIELELDFSEEEVEFADRTQLKELCGSIEEKLIQLVKSFNLGNAIKNGIPVAIVGEPNAGKSTLLNALLNEERAIVSDIAGTTRDAIEDHITLNGVSFRFIDTAGIRETDDTIENLGIEKTFEKLAQAEIVILMIDSKTSLQTIINSSSQIRAKMNDTQRLIVLLNKADLVEKETMDDLQNRSHYSFLTDADVILPFSAKKKLNLEKLEEELGKAASVAQIDENDAIVTNARHHQALSLALEATERVKDGLQNGLPSDLVALEIRQILHHLGEITGAISNDEVLGNIFKNFCIGK